MKRLAAAAIAIGVLGASCAGHNGSSIVPSGASSHSIAGAPSKLGSGLTRRAAITTVPTGWAATGTQALKIVNATDLGKASGSQAITVRLGLQMRNASQLQSLVQSGQTVSTSTFLSTYAPASSQVSAVKSYLQSKGFSGITVEPDNLLLSAKGTVGQAESAFNTTIHSYSGGGTAFLANTSPAYVPQSLGGTVVAVLGLNNVQAFKPKPQLTNCSIEGESTPPQACLRWYDPDTFQIAYDAKSVATGSSTPVAIMAEGNVTPSITDLRTNEQKDGLPQIPVNVVQVGLASPDTAGDDEWTLDMTYSQGIAQTLSAIYIYATTSLTDSDIALEYSKWVTQHKTNIGNSSFGGCEFFPYLDGSMLVDDEELLHGASQGQTMFASSGDNGGYCNNFVDTNGAPGGLPFVMYPAASPYVVAVGGTELYSNADGSYKGEDPWPAGGGGLSQFEYSPYWEAEAQPVSQQGESFRGVPDVAMNAGEGPIGNAIIYSNASAVNGGNCSSGCVTGGTSLASPLTAGSWARIESAHGNHLGFAAPYFYKNYSSNAAGAINAGPPAWRPDGGFHDVLTGTNGLYTSLPGYDYTTGLGSLDVGLLNKEL